MKNWLSHMYKNYWTPIALRIIVLNLYLILKLAASISDQRGLSTISSYSSSPRKRQISA